MNTDEISRADSESEVLEQHMDGLNIQSAQPDRTVQDRPSWYARDADGQGEEAGDTQGVGIKSDNRRWVMPGDPDEPIEDPMHKTWAGETWSISKYMLGGMSRFLQMYDVNMNSFVKVFRHITNKNISEKAEKFAGMTRDGAFASAIAEIFDSLSTTPLKARA